MSRLRPFGDTILVADPPRTDTSSTGLYLPEGVHEIATGVVESIGDGTKIGDVTISSAACIVASESA